MSFFLAIDTPLNSTWLHPVPVNASMKAWVEDNDEDEDLIDWDFEEDIMTARLD